MNEVESLRKELAEVKQEREMWVYNANVFDKSRMKAEEERDQFKRANEFLRTALGKEGETFIKALLERDELAAQVAQAGELMELVDRATYLVAREPETDNWHLPAKRILSRPAPEAYKRMREEIGSKWAEAWRQYRDYHIFTPKAYGISQEEHDKRKKAAYKQLQSLMAPFELQAEQEKAAEAKE